MLTDFEKIPWIVITLECDFFCNYCSTPYAETDEIGPEQWIELINSQPYEKVVFTGGEPLMYKGLFDVIKGIEIPSIIFTNLHAWKKEYSFELDRNKTSFYISWHPQYEDLDDFVEKVIDLRDNKYNIEGVFWVRFSKIDAKILKNVRYIEEQFKSKGMEFDPYGFKEVRDQREIKLTRAPSTCRIDRTLLGPDGKRYPCITLLRQQSKSIKLDHYDGIYCDSRKCTPCDAAVLTHKG